jgi:hypothetical protein
VNEPIDTLDAHLAEAGSIERAARPLGMYLAWCANLHLLSAGFQQAHESVLVRLRYRDMTPAEFLIASGDGSVRMEDLNEEGRVFSRTYYPHYLDDFRETFEGEVYGVKDDWAHYDQIAAVLTRHFMTLKGHKRQNRERSGVKKWWKVWQ